MADERMSLAEERDIIRRFGPSAMRAVFSEASGYPCRIVRAEIIDVDWNLGEVTLRETGDPHIKEHVRWLPPYHPTWTDLVWYMKFGNDGIVLGRSMGDAIERGSVGEGWVGQASSPNNAIFQTTSAPYVSDATNGPVVDCSVDIGEPIEVTISGNYFIDLAGTNGAVFSWRAVDLGGTPMYGDDDDDGCESGVVGEWNFGSRTTLWIPTDEGQYELEMRYKRVGSTGTANYKNRRISFRRAGGHVE